MKKPYSPPTIEQWVSDAFIAADILYPSDLVPERIAKAFNIDYFNWPGRAYSFQVAERSEAYIVGDNKASTVQKRIEFFHELGHLLRHAGDQCNMPESFRKMQEADANLFVMYASIPFHMIDFSKANTVKSIMDEFHVNRDLAYTRIEDIRTKTFFEQQRRRQQYHPVFSPFSLDKCCDETKRIMGQLSRQTGVKYF